LSRRRAAAALTALLACAPAAAGEGDTSVLIGPGQLRVMVLSDTPGTTTAGGTDLSPTMPGGRYVYLPGAAVPEAGVPALLAPLGADQARAAAGAVASRDPLVGTLARTARDVDVTEGAPPAERCRHARLERVTLTLAVGGLVLAGERALADREAATPGPCPAPPG
jgi:hypothetical protein